MVDPGSLTGWLLVSMRGEPLHGEVVLEFRRAGKIVTRWECDGSEIIRNSETGLPVNVRAWSEEQAPTRRVITINDRGLVVSEVLS